MKLDQELDFFKLVQELEWVEMKNYTVAHAYYNEQNTRNRASN